MFADISNFRFNCMASMYLQNISMHILHFTKLGMNYTFLIRAIVFIQISLHTKIALEFLMYNVTHYHKVVVLDKNMARPFIEALLPLCTLSSMGVCCLLTHNSPF